MEHATPPVDLVSYVFFFFIQGRFTIAAKHHINIAEIYETELVDIDKVRLNICVLLCIVHIHLKHIP